MNLYYKKILYNLENKEYTICLDVINEHKNKIINNKIPNLLLDFIAIFCLIKTKKYNMCLNFLNDIIISEEYNNINNLHEIIKEFSGMQLLYFIYILLVINKNYSYINTQNSDIIMIKYLLNEVKKIKNIPRLQNITHLYEEYITIFNEYVEKNELPPNTIILNRSLLFPFNLYEDKLIDHLKIFLI